MGRQCAQNINELFEDCRRGHTHSVQLWIAQKSKKQRSPLNFLRSSGNSAFGAGTFGWLVDLREPSTAYTLLHLTALHGHRELTRLLITRDAQLATARDRKGCLPLHLAAWNGHEEVIEALLAAAPASVNAVNNARESGLHLATLNGHANAARLLLKHHADARLRNARLETALDIAVRTDKGNVCRLLMLNCPELSLMCAADCCSSAPTPTSPALKPLTPPYPLHSAARLGHTDCVDALLEHGFDPNYLGPSGTALHVAARQGQCATLKALVNNGATLDICDAHGQTALEWLSTRLSSSTPEDTDEGMMGQRLRECQRLLEEAEHHRRGPQPEEHQRGTLRVPAGIWKNAEPVPKSKQYNNNRALKSGTRVAVPPPLAVASTRSHSQPISSPTSLRGTFSPSSCCTYQPLPSREIGMDQVSMISPLSCYQNVPKATLTYDNAPPTATGRQSKWVHNCANGCALPDNLDDRNTTNVQMASSDKKWHRSANVCSPCAELGLIQLPSVEDLSPCSTLGRSPPPPQYTRYGGGTFRDTVAVAEAAHFPSYGGGAPLAAHDELLSASVTPLPNSPERSVGTTNGKILASKRSMSAEDDDKSSSTGANAIASLVMPSCSSSIATLAPDSTTLSSCSLQMLSNLSLSSGSAAASPQRAATSGGEASSFHYCASPKSDKKSMIGSPPRNANSRHYYQQQQQQQQMRITTAATTLNPKCANGNAQVPSSECGRGVISACSSAAPASMAMAASAAPRGVRQLVHWMEEQQEDTTNKALVVVLHNQLHHGHDQSQPINKMINGDDGARGGTTTIDRRPSAQVQAVQQQEQSAVAVSGSSEVSGNDQHGEDEAVHRHAASSVSPKKQSLVDHEAQWKEIDELLHSIQRDSQLIAHNEEQTSHSLIKNSSKNSVSSMNSSSSPNSSGNGTACAYQPIVRWLRIQVGLSRRDQQQQQNQTVSAQELGELLHRHGFDTVRFMKGSLNTALMHEMGIPRRVQLQICRLLNDNAVPENIRSAEQFEFVSDWLDSLDLLDHLGSFATANLTATTDVIAAKLSRGDLEKMNVTQLGHIARITRSLDLASQQLKKWQQKQTNLNAFGAAPSPTLSAGNGSARENVAAAPFMSKSPDNNNSEQQQQHNSRVMASQSPPAAITDIAELRVRLTEGAGARFSAHYLGTTEISNVEGTDDCRRAMRSAKTRVRQTADVPWVMLEISVSGINIRDINNKLLYRHPIGHIQVVCQDEVDLNCFAYIFQEGERHFCYIFCVFTAIIAKEVIVTLGETFNLAYQIAIQQ